MSIAGLLDKVCTILTSTRVQEDSGQVSLTWSDKATNVPTRVIEEPTPNILKDLGPVSVNSFRFHFSPFVEITAGEKIEYDAKLFDVLLVIKDSSGHHLTVYAKQISLI